MTAGGWVQNDIVLVGGGHEHVQVIRDFARWPEAGTRLTLVTEHLTTPYPNMLPGCIAGDYRPDDMHIDLARLCSAAGCRLMYAAVTGVDRPGRRLLMEGRPPLAYDVVSFNVETVPDLNDIGGAREHALAVKPVGHFLRRFDALLSRALQPGGPRHFAVVGAGPAGVELALAVSERLKREGAGAGLSPDLFEVALFSRGPVVSDLNERMRRAARRALTEGAIGLHENAPIIGIDAAGVITETGFRYPCDAVIVSTDSRLPDWLAATGLPIDEKGGLAIRPTMQIVGDDAIFASGECASMVGARRETVGVHAVRQGTMLTRNLRRRVRGQALVPHAPQRSAFMLLRLPAGRALGGKGRRLAFSGHWVWLLKDRIDRGFVATLQPETMGAALRPIAAGTARNGGSTASLARKGLIDAGPPRDEVTTVDQLSAFVDDPFLFGRIAANHALGGLLARFALPERAMVLVTLPPAPAAKSEETVFQLLAGATTIFDRERVELGGGQTGEGQEIMLGFAMTGRTAAAGSGAIAPGDCLILTKPLGTGCILTAHRTAQARGQWLEAAFDSMQASSRTAADILFSFGCRSATDIKGDGLGGGLCRLLHTGRAAEINLSEIPLLPGSFHLAQSGVVASLAHGAREMLTRFQTSAPMGEVTTALLLDPQTAGGLLAAVPEAAIEPCLIALRNAGHPASMIGQVLPFDGSIRLLGSFGAESIPEAPHRSPFSRTLPVGAGVLGGLVGDPDLEPAPIAYFAG